jgi:deoxyribose-phosphate aldolase
MGVKAAGGVRRLRGPRRDGQGEATRIGASAGIRIVQQARGGATAAAPGTGY